MPDDHSIARRRRLSVLAYTAGYDCRTRGNCSAGPVLPIISAMAEKQRVNTPLRSEVSMRHALVVEDDADLAEMLAALIASEGGFTTATAHSLYDARRQLALQELSLIHI